MNEQRILIVDDELNLARNIQAYFDSEGFIARTVADGSSALAELTMFKPDLVILDIMLPGMDGLEVLRRLRQTSEVYVLLLTAKTDELDKIIGLTLGADDYLTKPFSIKELVARVKAILRRGRGGTPDTDLHFKRIKIDPDGRLAFKDGLPLDVTPTEYDILHVLALNRGRVISREQLIEWVWGPDYYGDERVVDVHIGRLRRKVEDDSANPSLIVTARAAGYRFEDDLP